MRPNPGRIIEGVSSPKFRPQPRIKGRVALHVWPRVGIPSPTAPATPPRLRLAQSNSRGGRPQSKSHGGDKEQAPRRSTPAPPGARLPLPTLAAHAMQAPIRALPMPCRRYFSSTNSPSTSAAASWGNQLATAKPVSAAAYAIRSSRKDAEGDFRGGGGRGKQNLFVIAAVPVRGLQRVGGEHQHLVDILRRHGADTEAHVQPRLWRRKTSASERRR